MDIKTYSAAERDLVNEWCANCLELMALIMDKTGAEPPTAIEEIEYQCLRSWLTEYQDQVMPLWTDFDQAEDKDLNWDVQLEYKLDQESFLGDHDLSFTPIGGNEILEQIKNQWDKFCRYGEEPSYNIVENNDDDNDKKYLDNTVLIFYEPKSLHQLAYKIGLQNNLEDWRPPDEYWASRIRRLLVCTSGWTAGFRDWVGKHTAY